jgi:hypothetical protein
VSAAHEPLDRVDRAFRVGDGLPAGDIAHEGLTLVVEGDHARREAIALLVRDHLGLLALHHRDDGVRRAEVDADDLFALLRCHDCWFPLGRRGGGPWPGPNVIFGPSRVAVPKMQSPCQPFPDRGQQPVCLYLRRGSAG